MAQSANATKIMSPGIPRWVFRWIHIVLAIPIYGYIYSPFDKLPQYAPPTRYVFFPLMLLTGLWMWKGHVVMRFFAKRRAQLDAGKSQPANNV